MPSNSFISVFSGAGGLDLGLEMAGLSCRYASDIDPIAVETMLANQPSGHLKNAVIECADIQNKTGSEILSKIGLSVGDVPLLVGGPPCQSWSSAGHQKGFSDPRGKLFDDFVRLAGELKVRYLMFENVRGLLTARGPDGKPGSALHLIREKLFAAGFQTQVALINAADFGVPQRRVRLFVFGYKVGGELTFPVPSHSKKSDDAKNGTKNWVPLKNVLLKASLLDESEVIRPSEKLLAQLSKIPSGSGVKSQGKKEATRPGGHWGYKQGAFIADTNLPSRTVTANTQQDWIRDPMLGIRRLCPKECAAIQTFPNDWIFNGKRNQQYKQIGNAVPPLLAMKIGESIVQHLEQADNDGKTSFHKLTPLEPKLSAAVKYTLKEQIRNGPSRASAPQKRKEKMAAAE